MDILIPPALLSGSNSGECSVLVQIEPDDATVLDFEGQTGAIGRFEADDEGVTLDLKGYQYSGAIHPGPTAMVVALGKSGHLKVDSVTDEFVTLQKTSDVMAKLDAVVKGSMDEGYNVVDDDVNKRSNQQENDKNAKPDAKKKDTAPAAKKRKTVVKAKNK